MTTAIQLGVKLVLVHYNLVHIHLDQAATYITSLIQIHKYRASNISFSLQGHMVLHIPWRCGLWLFTLHSVFGEMVLFTSLYGCRLVKLWCCPNTISCHYNLLQQQNCGTTIRECAADPTLERTYENGSKIPKAFQKGSDCNCYGPRKSTHVE